MKVHFTGQSAKWLSLGARSIDFRAWEGNGDDDDDNSDDAAGADVAALLAAGPCAPVVAMATAEKIEIAQEMHRRAAAAAAAAAGKLVRDAVRCW